MDELYYQANFRLQVLQQNKHAETMQGQQARVCFNLVVMEGRSSVLNQLLLHLTRNWVRRTMDSIFWFIASGRTRWPAFPGAPTT